MVDLHSWIQAWSDEGDEMCVRVVCFAGIDRTTLRESTAIEASLHEVLLRTTAPLRMVQQLQG